MFNNIGGKIKVLAKVLCWVGIILSVIMGIVMMASGGNARYNLNGSYVSGSGVVVGILIIVIGCLGSWVGSFFAYGFGQLIENTDAIRSNTNGASENKY